MSSIHNPEFSRNFGFMNEAEQQAIFDSRVAIAGVGGDGYQLGLKLARMGVQTFDIADPEVFEPENSNRVPGARHSTYGKKKSEVFLDEVMDINPEADVRIFDDGVTPENTEEFLRRATLVFDESELTYLHVGTGIAREARKKNIPDVMVMNIGFAAQVTSFHPESKHTFEKMMGVPDGMPLDEVKELDVDFTRCLPYLPKYADLSTLEAVQGGAPLPSISQGVDVACALGSSQAFLHMVSSAGNKRAQPVWSSNIRYMDAYDGTSATTRFPRVSYYRHLAHAAARNMLGINPDASYTQDDRNRRNESFDAV